METLSSFADLLEQDLRNLQSNIAKYTIQKMADDLTKECEKAIETFYSQYDPEDPSLHNGRVYYYRHWNFRKSYKRYYDNHDPKFVGGVELLIDSLPNVYEGTNSDPRSVFGRVYLGYHGIASFQGRAPIMSPSPMRLIVEKYYEILNNKDEYFDEAVSKALKNSYNIIA